MMFYAQKGSSVVYEAKFLLLTANADWEVSDLQSTAIP